AGEDELVFTASGGARIDPSNLMSRVLKPAARAAGVGDWVGFHTFRHTCATLLFRHGWNAVQVQRWLGHHKPSFTLDVYVHLLDEDVPEPAFFDAIGRSCDQPVTHEGRNQPKSDAESADHVAGISPPNGTLSPATPRPAETAGASF
ncbi:MAG TPA: tyrosine-type recombinase/integrase, partial [Gaiellaceae bacterium]|nr:tyrosine-type recombinase/integrase [Gaiellaceae bacterium]